MGPAEFLGATFYETFVEVLSLLNLNVPSSEVVEVLSNPAAASDQLQLGAQITSSTVAVETGASADTKAIPRCSATEPSEPAVSAEAALPCSASQPSKPAVPAAATLPCSASQPAVRAAAALACSVSEPSDPAVPAAAALPCSASQLAVVAGQKLDFALAKGVTMEVIGRNAGLTEAADAEYQEMRENLLRDLQSEVLRVTPPGEHISMIMEDCEGEKIETFFYQIGIRLQMTTDTLMEMIQKLNERIVEKDRRINDLVNLNSHLSLQADSASSAAQQQEFRQENLVVRVRNPNDHMAHEPHPLERGLYYRLAATTTLLEQRVAGRGAHQDVEREGEGETGGV